MKENQLYSVTRELIAELIGKPERREWKGCVLSKQVALPFGWCFFSVYLV